MIAAQARQDHPHRVADERARAAERRAVHGGQRRRPAADARHGRRARAHNIQVNAIAPGYFATEMNRALIDDAEFNAWVQGARRAGRWGEPEEICGTRRVSRVGRGELHHRADGDDRRRDVCRAVSGRRGPAQRWIDGNRESAREATRRRPASVRSRKEADAVSGRRRQIAARSGDRGLLFHAADTGRLVVGLVCQRSSSRPAGLRVADAPRDSTSRRQSRISAGGRHADVPGSVAAGQEADAVSGRRRYRER